MTEPLTCVQCGGPVTIDRVEIEDITRRPPEKRMVDQITCVNECHTRRKP